MYNEDHKKLLKVKQNKTRSIIKTKEKDHAKRNIKEKVTVFFLTTAVCHLLFIILNSSGIIQIHLQNFINS